jgi:hypothetical protein
VGYTVQERAECVGTFRWIEIRLMRILAQWVPTTPQMEVKILFGRHVWDCARHADALGKRAFELRAPLHYTLPASAAFNEFLDEIAGLSLTADRVAGFYDVACPIVAEQYRLYIGLTDSLMDEPTVRILDDALRDVARMGTERGRLVGGLSLGEQTIEPKNWFDRQAAIADIVEHGGDNGRLRGIAS